MDYADYIADPSRDCAIVVHRGIWRAAPENSLLAIERAMSAGYDAVEIDVRCSSDGESFSCMTIRLSGRPASSRRQRG
ncbi:glycerophosphodiester phosphodiesterase [Rhizobium sp. P40RR-XXII]|uniref:glycerophosphodiester phosphodiesterase n=1 Tax=Rhizobium sp. P40RR-XXII TaxID=2726739 RepID=UPI001FEF5547|nr:glycerophosphodiester phosphodiesterase family protein [Rhizobium sp. P40RR-XXII]